VGAEISDTSCDVHVLVDEAAEAIASQRPDGRAGAWGIGSGGRLLLEEPVRPVGVVVLDELTEYHGEVTRSGDQEVIEAFAAQGADDPSVIASARGARTGVRMMAMSAPAKTASKAALNLLSRSRITNRNWAVRSPRSISKLRACWVTQAPMG